MHVQTYVARIVKEVLDATGRVAPAPPAVCCALRACVFAKQCMPGIASSTCTALDGCRARPDPRS